MLQDYSLFRRDRPNKTHGGLLVFARTDLGVRRRLDLENPEIELITLEVTLPIHGSLLLFFSYRPPDYSPDVFFSALSTLMARATPSSTIVLLGDLNAKHARWDRSSSPNTAGNRACILLDDFNLTQCVTAPTRYSSDGTTCSVLDIFATNRPDLVEQVEVSDPISDHCRVDVKLGITTPTPKKRSITYLDYTNADWEGLGSALFRSSLTQAIQGTSNVNTAWTVWETIVLQIIIIIIFYLQDSPAGKNTLIEGVSVDVK